MRLFELTQPVTIDKNQIQRESEQVWSHFGVSIGCTDHFLQQVELERNSPPITSNEIISLLVLQCYRHGKEIINLQNNAEIVLKDTTSNINIPTIFKVDPNIGAKLILKTAIRRENFRTSSPITRVRSK